MPNVFVFIGNLKLVYKQSLQASLIGLLVYSLIDYLVNPGILITSIARIWYRA
jgi:hypothetical protein